MRLCPPPRSRAVLYGALCGLLVGLAGCLGTRPAAPAEGPFHLVYDGSREDAHRALLDAVAAARFEVARDDRDLGLVRTAPRRLLAPERMPTTAGVFPVGPRPAPPDTARVWFRLAERQDGQTVLAARPLLAIAVPRDADSDASPLVPLLADVPATHPLARHVVGQLGAAGFTLLPAESPAFAGLDLSTEVYDDQP